MDTLAGRCEFAVLELVEGDVKTCTHIPGKSGLKERQLLCLLGKKKKWGVTNHNNRDKHHDYTHESHDEVYILAGLRLFLSSLLLYLRDDAGRTTLSFLGILTWENVLNEFLNLYSN